MTPAPTKHLLTVFTDLHLQSFGVPAVLSGGRDAKILKELWLTHPDLVEPIMIAFFAERDPWVIAHGGMSVPMFRHRFASLLLTHQKSALRSQTEAEDWFTECQRNCGGRCGSRYKHSIFGIKS